MAESSSRGCKLCRGMTSDTATDVDGVSSSNALVGAFLDTKQPHVVPALDMKGVEYSSRLICYCVVFHGTMANSRLCEPMAWC